MDSKAKNIDKSPVDKDLLESYELEEEVTAHDSRIPSSAFMVEGVRCGSPFSDETLEYNISIEYRSTRSIVPDSLIDYLETFEEARLTQELMTRIIQNNITFQVKSAKVFVEVIEDSDYKKVNSVGSVR